MAEAWELAALQADTEHLPVGEPMLHVPSVAIEDQLVALLREINEEGAMTIHRAPQ
ncbi:hypothetical protein IQ216_05475 [Cyanobium sp. LEGE 06143]|uniref:hypothetical protein n=1 Tax=Cyanobium sp. LEGE 06143 TaxID=945727 RepID=UPI0018822732|nr:hypothetical protein [Cyanobium sp. LEGE 06143]MBE9172554.1 hypothetical protein [Cyanobium sp. LEGE 06143]